MTTSVTWKGDGHLRAQVCRWHGHICLQHSRPPLPGTGCRVQEVPRQKASFLGSETHGAESRPRGAHGAGWVADHQGPRPHAPVGRREPGPPTRDQSPRPGWATTLPSSSAPRKFLPGPGHTQAPPGKHAAAGACVAGGSLGGLRVSASDEGTASPPTGPLSLACVLSALLELSSP